METAEQIKQDELEGIRYLFSLAQWKGEAFNLDKIRRILFELGNPQDIPKSAIITGTNGKGSVSAALSAILGRQGFSVGLNTSPHLINIRERFLVDGKPLGDHVISEHALKLRDCCQKVNLTLSFHEAVTAVAFSAFRELDWIVMEVGLGGRLDAANVISDPEITSIVTVDYDHQHILGSTLSEIAFEKAGIIRKDSIAILGTLPREALEVVSRVCVERSAQMVQFGLDYSCNEISGKGGLLFKWHQTGETGQFRPPLLGSHQVHNAGVALALGRALGFPLSDCVEAVTEVKWPGRFEEVQYHGRRVILDCAHNPAGISALVATLNGVGISKFDVLFGVLQAKNWQAMTTALAPNVSAWWLTQSNHPLAVPTTECKQFVEKHGGKVARDGKDATEVFRQALADPSTPLVVCGSIYLTGIIREILANDGLVESWPQTWKRSKLVNLLTSQAMPF